MRMVTGLFRPKPGVPGFDLAGVVEAVGSGVTTFRPGDAVFGASHGTCAEFVSAPAGQLALKPTNLTFEQAAAVPTSALAALHGLRDAGGLKRGQKVLINGAAGGIGSRMRDRLKRRMRRSRMRGRASSTAAGARARRSGSCRATRCIR